ncbi:anaerobic sulfatase maturase [Vibrio sp. ZSDE26]|uniref:Anaerobic sulfatase maturase n=1 Tax=Vibrio amylolyticus TaxID=2847292 RepID=A0A9X2BG42_9VIBR|nr:anaerobic sulfatase maturase [Vibrio amylolyticus]MCK6262491.1 anaerobic sulfatase maturase [Vibrio amylolyticus]
MNSQVNNCQVMAKPSSSLCNLDCDYCFYLEKEKLYSSKIKVMDDHTLNNYIKQYIDAQETNHVSFSWQGGEPTLMGIDFFKKAMGLQRKHKGNKVILNTFQTNGILIDSEWCEFFKENNFLVGVSIDGPNTLHDKYRVSRSGRGTHDKVMQCIRLLNEHGVEFNSLTVVNNINCEYPIEVYEHLKSLGVKYMQFIPLVEQEASEITEDGLTLIYPGSGYKGTVTPWSVEPRKYGNFLCQIYDKWIVSDVSKVFVQMFDATLSAHHTGKTELCTFSETCGHAFALESNGDLYNCDHFVYPEYKVGNINDTSIRELNNTPKAVSFGENKMTALSSDCKKCAYLKLCNGGCPKHQFSKSPSNENNHNYFCESYKMFFSHTELHFRIMSKLLNQKRSPVELMLHIRNSLEEMRLSPPLRNERCLCGSGNKFKKCCHGKLA